MKILRRCTPRSLIIVCAATILASLAATSQTTFAFNWQASVAPFVHYQSFCGTVDAGGQEDGAVVYESGQRHVYAEGSYLQWSSGAISCIRYAYSQNPVSEVAIVFHAFNPNSSTCNAVQYMNGWAWSNLPGASAEMHSSCEERTFIGDPSSMSSSQIYYSQVAYNDTAYPGSKTSAEMDLSSYLIQISMVGETPVYRDFNAKVCESGDSAYTPNGGAGGTC